MSMLNIRKIKREDDKFKDNIELIKIIIKRTNKAPRTNQILALEITMTHDYDQNLSCLEFWKNRCRKWLKDTFDVVVGNQSNILSWKFHFDMEGNFYINALVIPIDEYGRLNATRFLQGHYTRNELKISFNEYTKI